MSEADLYTLFRDLTPEQLQELLRDLDARRRAVMAMLRAVRARDRDKRYRRGRKAVAHA